MSYVIVKRKDQGGAVTIISCKPGSEEYALQEYLKSSPVQYSHRDSPPIPVEYESHGIVDTLDLPSDRTFRNAWCCGHVKGKVDVQMSKARDIWRDKLRVARAKKLESLDVQYMRADEAGDAAAKAAIADKKQALRDVTADPRIESCATPEELKAFWPDCLK